MEKLKKFCNSVFRKLRKVNFKAFDWPPLASHLFMFALGVLVNLYQAKQPDLVGRLRPGEGLIKPNKSLGNKIAQSHVGSFFYFGQQNKKGICLVSKTPLSVEWLADGQPVIAFRARLFDKKILRLLQLRSPKNIAIMTHVGLDLCESRPKLKY